LKTLDELMTSNCSSEDDAKGTPLHSATNMCGCVSLYFRGYILVILLTFFLYTALPKQFSVNEWTEGICFDFFGSIA
jgi:hypothetical protein